MDINTWPLKLLVEPHRHIQSQPHYNPVGEEVLNGLYSKRIPRVKVVARVQKEAIVEARARKEARAEIERMAKATRKTSTPRTKKSPHPQLPKVTPKKVIRKPRAPKKKPAPESIDLAKAPDTIIQPHISIALESNHRSGTRNAVYSLSENKVAPNKKMKPIVKAARYGSKQGLPGPSSDFAAPIVRASPRGVSDMRQLLINSPNNEVPDEFGVTNKHRMPMQNIVPTAGGKYSGRTGPIR